MEKIERDNGPLSEVEREVKERILYDPRNTILSSMNVEDILSNLSGKQRECFELVVIDGMTEREAALKLNISKSSVQVYIRRSKEKLKNILSGVMQKPSKCPIPMEGSK